MNLSNNENNTNNAEKSQQTSVKMLNMDVLLETIKNATYFPEKRNENGEFLFAVDHCFTIKGQGAIMTGTILNGQVKINDVNQRLYSFIIFLLENGFTPKKRFHLIARTWFIFVHGNNFTERQFV